MVRRTSKLLRRRAPHADVERAPAVILQRGTPWSPPVDDLAPISAAPGGVTYIGRAPVFDRRLDVIGFQLLVDTLRAEEPVGDHLPGAPTAGDAAIPPPVPSRQVLTRALLEVGLDSLIGSRTGFVAVDLDVLDDGLHRALPEHRMVLEVRGPIDQEGEALLREVREDGYTVLVDSIDEHERPGDVLQIAAGAHVDLASGELDDVTRHLARWNPRARLLVTGLTSSDDVEPCRDHGASWLRGEVLRPTEVIDEPTVPASRVAVLELLAELERPDVDIDDIDRLVSIDLGMSYKVLRMANSSYLALERRVERTRDAVVYLGIDTVRAVAALLALSEATDHPPEIVHISLLRAKHCEEIAKVTHPGLAHAAFTTGLFSGLDLLLGLTVEQVLDRIPVSDDIAGALRDRSGRLGRILSIVTAYERHDLTTLARSDVEPGTVVIAYRHALNWVGRITKSLA